MLEVRELRLYLHHQGNVGGFRTSDDDVGLECHIPRLASHPKKLFRSPRLALPARSGPAIPASLALPRPKDAAPLPDRPPCSPGCIAPGKSAASPLPSPSPRTGTRSAIRR